MHAKNAAACTVLVAECRREKKSVVEVLNDSATIGIARGCTGCTCTPEGENELFRG